MNHSSKITILTLMLPVFWATITFESAWAQTHDSTLPVKPVPLSASQWKSLEGYFQSAGNKDLYVQFTAKNDTLLGKLLWNNNQVHLLPVTPLSFVSIEAEDHGPIHVNFSKDASGEVLQVNVADNGIWNRVKNYTPVVKKEVPHTAAQLKKFEGLYRLTNDSSRFIQFTEKDNQLVLKQHWDGNTVIFLPETELDFFSTQVPQFALSFVKNQQGDIDQALAFKRDKWNKITKTLPSAQLLKSYEGKYQFKDDPDNVIQITARGNNLVVKQLWDAKETIVEPQTVNYFYNNAASFPLLIINNNNGAVLQLQTLDGNIFSRMKE